MDTYLAFFLVGCGGLVVMAGLGAIGGHGHHAGGNHGHDAGGFHLHGTGAHAHGPANTALHHSPVAHSGAAQSHGAAAHQGHQSHAHASANHSGFNLRAAVMGWLSPRVLLTLSMGTGATGVILAGVLPGEPLRGLASLAGGIALEKLVVAPMWNVLTRFASKPARTLDSAVMEEATAIANFDTQGFGMVTINLDGHEMRLLARLSPQHRDGRVRMGDKLLVEDVDGARGQCVVSPMSKMLP